MESTKSFENIKISFLSLGCDKNLVDTEIMLGLIDDKGYEIIKNHENADIIIVNTCGFKMDATQEGIDSILELSDYKKNGVCKGLIISGCMVQRYKDEIFKEIPEIDAIIGTSNIESIINVIERVLNKEEKIKEISNINNNIKDSFSLKRKLTTSHFAYLKIAEGCDNHCTYCTIPSLRGKYKSRSLESLIEEANFLSENGVKEIILVAQDTSLYGKDLYGEPKLYVLLHELSKIEKIKWIRILYCYPEHIDDKLIQEIATNEKVCKYIDMPIQHSDDYILKKMERKSSTKNLEEIINKLRKEIKDIVIRTTIIVGFPGESETHFNNLVNFIKKNKFDKLGVFTYSKEEGTKAYNFENQIEEDEKERRKNYILEIQKDISSEKLNSYIGSTLETIIEGKLENEDTYFGRAFSDCYEIDGLIFFKSNKILNLGEFINIKITNSLDYDLLGEIVYEPTK